VGCGPAGHLASGQSGVDVLKQIKSLRPEVKVLVLTMHPEDQYALRVLKAGASGYLTKETASSEVVKAVTRVLAGGKYLSSALAERLADNLHAPADKSLPRDFVRPRISGPPDAGRGQERQRNLL